MVGKRCGGVIGEEVWRCDREEVWRCERGRGVEV